jgi:hypothetical protein
MKVIVGDFDNSKNEKNKKIKNQIRRKDYEKNLSTQKETEKQSTRFP